MNISITNIKKSLTGINFALSRPRYVFLALVLAFFVSMLIFFLTNISHYGNILMTAPLDEKISIIPTLIETMIRSWLHNMSGVLLFVLALLQGISLSLLVYNFRMSRKISAKTVASNGLATIIAVIGLGCVSCGTSIIVPILTLVFTSFSYAILPFANMAIMVIAVILTIYAIYKIGLINYVNQITAEWEKEAKKIKK